VLPHCVTPFTAANRVAGPAFTGQGYPCASTPNDDTQTRLDMLDSITPGAVSVWDCGGGMECAHWARSCRPRRASEAAKERSSTVASAAWTSSTPCSIRCSRASFAGSFSIALPGEVTPERPVVFRGTFE
jgi:hypothetical protein